VNRPVALVDVGIVPGSPARRRDFTTAQGGEVHAWRSGEVAPWRKRKPIFSSVLRRQGEFATCPAQRGELARVDAAFAGSWARWAGRGAPPECLAKPRAQPIPAGLLSTSASKSVALLMSAAFCPGVVPSRVLWILTVGVEFSSSFGFPVAGVRAAIDVQGLAVHERHRAPRGNSMKLLPLAE
jgi:hypothetical protein